MPLLRRKLETNIPTSIDNVHSFLTNSVQHEATATYNMSSHNSSTANSSSKAPSAAPPLNMYMKVAVIRRASDSLQYEDNEGNPKTVSVQELGDAISTAVRLF